MCYPSIFCCVLTCREQDSVWLLLSPAGKHINAVSCFLHLNALAMHVEGVNFAIGLVIGA